MAMSGKTAKPAVSRAADPSAVPPGYKRTEVGVIPADWVILKFSDHFDIYAGGDVPKDSFSQTQSEKFPFPIYANAIKNKGLYGFTNQKRAKPDSFTITARGYLGHAEYREEPFFPIVRLLVFEPAGALDAKYTTFAVNERVHFSIESTGVPQLTAPQVGKYAVAAPPTLREQRAISETLSDVDALIGAVEKLIAKKRAIKQAVMQQLLAGKTRLPGFSGEWETKRLGDLVTFLRNGVNSRAELSQTGSVKYLHYGDIHTSTYVRLDIRFATMPYLPTDRAGTIDRLKDGDLVFVDASEDLDGVGRSVEISEVGDTEVVAGLHTIAARFDKAVLANGFKAYLQFCSVFRDHLRRLSAGTKVYATNRTHIASAEIPLPSAEEQTAIAAVLSSMDAEIEALERRRDKTKQIRQGMMQQLLTGRVRLVKPECRKATA
jgi:type I restriction enzyme, S subunit